MFTTLTPERRTVLILSIACNNCEAPAGPGPTDFLNLPRVAYGPFTQTCKELVGPTFRLSLHGFPVGAGVIYSH